MIFLNLDRRILRENLLVPTLNGPLSVVPRKKGEIWIWAKVLGSWGENDFDKCFFSFKKSGRGSPAQGRFLKFFSVLAVSKMGGNPDPGEISQQVYFLNLKNQAGVPLHKAGF